MKTMVFSSLRVRLILLVLAGVIPLLILLIYAGFELRNRAADDVQQDAAQLVIRAVNEQQRLVNETRQLLSVLAKVPQIQNDDIAGCNSFLGKLLGEVGVYANLGVVRPDGDVVCSGVPFQQAINAKNFAFFKRALHNQDFSIGDYRIGRITKTAVLVFSYPVLGDQKQLKAVLFASLPLSWINRQVAEYALPVGSVVRVIDYSTQTLLARYPESGAQIGSSVATAEFVKALHAAGGTGTAKVTDLDGVDRFYTFRRLSDLPGGKEIYLSFDIPSAVVYAEANAVVLRNLSILIVVMVLMLLLAWYGSYALVLKQVRELLAVTRQVASGQLDARVKISDSSNELSQLGREFNQMAVALEQRDSEATQARDLLSASESHLRDVLETVPDIIYTATASNDFNPTYVSHALTRILGFTPEECIADPKRWLASIHDEDRQRVITRIQYAMDKGKDSISLEYRIWHASGKIFRYFENRARINRDTLGQATVIYGVLTDITERKQAEMLSVRMGRILENSWDELYVFDAATLHFIDVSQGACQNLGYSLDEIKCLTPLDLKPNLTTEQFEALLGPLRRGEKPMASFEIMHRRKDGSHYPVEMRLQFSSAETPPVFIAIAQDISERKRYIAELEHKALYDNLTNLPNRTLFLDRLKHALKIARREALPLAVLTIDVVRLREVNDILGHGAGDIVLCEVATRLQENLRKSDTVARLVGDEFVIVMPRVGCKQVVVAAGKIQMMFEAPVVVDDVSLEIETAMGVALYPDHGDEPDMLLQHADIAMQVAKNEAGGFSIYKPGNEPYSLRKLKLLGELRQAIQQKELALYYQPKIDLTSGRVSSVEALARWPHSIEGVISPADFIPVIEQTGLIRPFTHWVLEEAVLQLKRWSRAAIDLTIAVNLSTRNLLDSELLDNVMRLLKRHDVSPAQLTFEVTESAVMSRPEAALKVLTQLHEAGFKLSIDDFGTGYSSLAYLKKLPVDELKIDQTFVFGIISDDDNAVIVRSTIELAQNMGLKVVAEGVEDQATMDMLRSLGCDLAQGYHMAHPMPVDQLDSWLKDSAWGLN